MSNTLIAGSKRITGLDIDYVMLCELFLHSINVPQAVQYYFLAGFEHLLQPHVVCCLLYLAYAVKHLPEEPYQVPFKQVCILHNIKYSLIMIAWMNKGSKLLNVIKLLIF